MESTKFLFKMGDIIVHVFINSNVPVVREKFVMQEKKEGF